jgi:hypothetical protein
MVFVPLLSEPESTCSQTGARRVPSGACRFIRLIPELACVGPVGNVVSCWNRQILARRPPLNASTQASCRVDVARCVKNALLRGGLPLLRRIGSEASPQTAENRLAQSGSASLPSVLALPRSARPRHLRMRDLGSKTCFIRRGLGLRRCLGDHRRCRRRMPTCRRYAELSASARPSEMHATQNARSATLVPTRDRLECGGIGFDHQVAFALHWAMPSGAGMNAHQSSLTEAVLHLNVILQWAL